MSALIPKRISTNSHEFLSEVVKFVWIKSRVKRSNPLAENKDGLLNCSTLIWMSFLGVPFKAGGPLRLPLLQKYLEI